MKPKSVKDLVEQFGGLAAFAEAVEAYLPPPVTIKHRARKWQQRNSIPSMYHLAVLEAAKARELEFSAETLVGIHSSNLDMDEL